MSTVGNFEMAGFICSWIERIGIKRIRAANKDWFTLVEDLNLIMMRTVSTGIKTARGHNWSQQTVAVRLLLRSTEAFQSVVLLSERGIVGPARALVRTIVEDSLCAGALLESPHIVVQAIREDAEASRRRQAKFVCDQGLGKNPIQLEKLRIAIAEMEKVSSIKWRDMAGLISMLPQYLNYCACRKTQCTRLQRRCIGL